MEFLIDTWNEPLGILFLIIIAFVIYNFFKYLFYDDNDGFIFKDIFDFTDYNKIYSSIRLDDNNIMNSLLKGPCPKNKKELKIFLERIDEIKRKRGLK